MKTFGWYVARSGEEIRQIKAGSTEVLESTVETFQRAKKSIEELVKVAEKVYEQLTKKAANMESAGKETLAKIKKGKFKFHGTLGGKANPRTNLAHKVQCV